MGHQTDSNVRNTKNQDNKVKLDSNNRGNSHRGDNSRNNSHRQNNSHGQNHPTKKHSLIDLSKPDKRDHKGNAQDHDHKAKTTKATTTETTQPPTVAKEERDILDLTKQIVDVRKDVQKEEGEIQDLRKDVTSAAGH